MHLVPISRELVECCPQSARESVQTGPQTTGQAAQEKEDEVNLLTTSDLWILTSDLWPCPSSDRPWGCREGTCGSCRGASTGGTTSRATSRLWSRLFYWKLCEKRKRECLGVIWKCGWYSKLDNWDQFLSGGAWWAAWHSLLPGLYREEPWQDVLLGLISTHTK